MKDFFEMLYYRTIDFIENWIYPAYHLKNLLFNRYNSISTDKILPWQYCDVSDRMFYFNMELIREFIEKANPEKYICWYEDDEGNSVGNKYEEYEDYPIMFPEYRGKYIMDIIKEIYNWYKSDYEIMVNDENYLCHFWAEYFSEINLMDDEMNKRKKDIPETLDFFDDKNVDWTIIDKYTDKNRENVLVSGFIYSKLYELKRKIECEKQKYLHLCIEIRSYLWI